MTKEGNYPETQVYEEHCDSRYRKQRNAKAEKMWNSVSTNQTKVNLANSVLVDSPVKSKRDRVLDRFKRM